MADRRTVLFGAALVTLIMVVSSLGLLAAAGPAMSGRPASEARGVITTSASSTAGTSSSLLAPSLSSGGSNGPPVPVNPSGPTLAQNPMAVSALAAAAADGIPTRDLFVPRAGATPSQIAETRAQGYVTPGYGENSPAPVGLAYYGLSAGAGGSIVATTLQTSSLFATVDTNSFGIEPAYPFTSSPDGYGIQLNAVTTNINLFGTGGYSMWTQNVFEFLPSLGQVNLVTNVWNFSGNGLTASAIYQHGPYGTIVPGELYYAQKVITGVTYPLNLDLWMNNSVVSGRNEVSFTVGLTTGGTTTIYPYDYVIFNSTGTPTNSEYTADGTNLNPLGLTNDFELILGGPGGGSQADLLAADANLTLDYWNSVHSTYAPIPAAYSYGSETGETVTGAYVGWENNSQGPYGVMTSGPGMLQGLWNATGSEGVTPVTFAVTPSNGFYFVAPNWASNFTYEGELDWAPQETNGGTFDLAPGAYNYTIYLSEYDSVVGEFVVGSTPMTITLSLVSDPSQGIYTPLWAWTNAQLASLSTYGSGTPSSPYEVENGASHSFPSLFGYMNDFTFPVFSGVFFWGTTASVMLNDMPALPTALPYAGWPSTKDLGYVFENTLNVALVNSTHLSVWFPSSLDAPLFNGSAFPYLGNYYGTYTVEAWNTTDTLIADDDFGTQAAGAILADGTHNTVWGNKFTMVNQPNLAETGLAPLNLSLGLMVVEGGDLIYNNAFDTTYTAISPPQNIYNDASTYWQNAWNITPQPATNVHFAAGFDDFPLTGTILVNATQGGNYWHDYGSTKNPRDHFPYDEFVDVQGYGNPQIAVGGDYYPLTLAKEYSITFDESGLAPGTGWQVTLGSTAATSTGTAITFPTYNGSYSYTVAPVAGFTADPMSGTQGVSGGNVTVTITFTSVAGPWTVGFVETGLPPNTDWSVTFNSVEKSSGGADSIDFTSANGTYGYTVTPVPGYGPAPSSGQVTIAGGPPTVTSIGFTYSLAPTYDVAFTETGLPSGSNWSVTFDSLLHYSGGTATVSFVSGNGTFGFTVTAVVGFTANVTAGALVVNGANFTELLRFTSSAPATYSVTFTESGLPTGTSWSVTLAGSTRYSNATTVPFSGLLNDSYAYSVGAVPGFASSTSSGTVTVTGADRTVSVAFSSNSGSGSSGGLSTLDWAIIGLVVAVVIAAVAVVLLRRGGSGAGPASQEPEPNATSEEPGADGSNPDDELYGEGPA